MYQDKKKKAKKDLFGRHLTPISGIHSTMTSNPLLERHRYPRQPPDLVYKPLSLWPGLNLGSALLRIGGNRVQRTAFKHSLVISSTIWIWFDFSSINRLCSNFVIIFNGPLLGLSRPHQYSRHRPDCGSKQTLFTRSSSLGFQTKRGTRPKNGPTTIAFEYTTQI